MAKRKSKFTSGNFRLRVGKSATGKGLYTMENIPKGACIIEYFGTPIQVEKQENATGKYLFETGRNKMVNGNIPANTARYINHSCVGNCEAEGPSGKVYIMAKRRIKAGAELTYDYGKEYKEEYIDPVGCRCSKCQTKKK